MSKLLPKIKKKLKGKEEEIVAELRKKGKEEDHDSKKKHGKGLKPHSPLIGGPLSPSKHEKKKKAGKNKSTGDKDRQREFFGDDGGKSELYVDKNGALKEIQGDNFTDSTLEDDHRNSQSSVKMVDILEASYRDDFDMDNPQDQSARSEYSTLDFDVDGFRVESPHGEKDGEDSGSIASFTYEAVKVESGEALYKTDDSLKEKDSENNQNNETEKSKNTDNYETEIKNTENFETEASKHTENYETEIKSTENYETQKSKHTENHETEIKNTENYETEKSKHTEDNETENRPSESNIKASNLVLDTEPLNDTEYTEIADKNCQSDAILCQDKEESVTVDKEDKGQEIPADNIGGEKIDDSNTNMRDEEIKDEICSHDIPTKSMEDSTHLSSRNDDGESEDADGGRVVEGDEDAVGENKIVGENECEKRKDGGEKGDNEGDDAGGKCDDGPIVDEISSPTSQDSDEDFDSAKEDWDDDEGDDSGANQQSPVRHDFGETKSPHGQSDEAIGEVIEATNKGLVNSEEDNDEEQDSRGFSTSSSLYQDAAMSRENSETLDISSIAEAVNGDLELDAEDSEADKKNANQHEKLTRKISNISVASSDVFDEELDELLDEELDRLSEVEEAELVHVKEIPATVISEPLSEHDKEMVDGSSVQSEERTQEPETNLTETNINPVPEVSETELAKTDNRSLSSDSEQALLNDNTESKIKEEQCVSKDGEGREEIGEKRGQKDGGQEEGEEKDTEHKDKGQNGVGKDEKGQKKDGVKKSLLSPEDTPEETKDSGYYSLPVSPAVARGSDPPPAAPIHPDDSFGDSEEDGMVTPPSEVTGSPTTKSTSVTPPSDASVTHTEKSNAVTPANEVGASSNENTKLSEVEAPLKDEDSSSDDDSTSEAKTIEESPGSEKEEDPQTPEEKTKLFEKDEKVVGGEEILLKPKVLEGAKTDKEETLPKLKMPQQPLDLKDGYASPRSGSSTPTPQNPRHKNSISGGDHRHHHREEGALSPDPVGELFLQQAVCLSHEEAEARLAQRRAARAEARELRLRELEKQQHEQENEEDKLPSTPQPYQEAGGTRVVGGGARTGAVGRSPAVNCIAGGQYSRRSSEDSTTDESLPANVREMRAELKELDEKFRKAMITNAQLDNEKATLTFEVELLKDRYTELEETHTQLTKEHRRKCTEYEQLRKVSTKLQEEVKVLRGLLQERDQLIQEYGLVVIGEEENGEEDGEVTREEEEDDVEDLSPRKILVKKALISQEAADLLSKGAAKGSLDVRLKKFGEEKNELEDQVRRLKLELEEERSKNRRRENGLDYEKQKEQSKTVNEYKFRVQKAEAEVSTLQANVARLDALSARYKTQSEELEKSEEELKMEKRKLQRELRDAQSRLEELETTNNHLIKRFDKLKNARSNLLKDLSQDPA